MRAGVVGARVRVLKSWPYPRLVSLCPSAFGLGWPGVLSSVEFVRSVRSVLTVVVCARVVWLGLIVQTAGAGTGFLVRQLLRNEKLIPDDHEEPPIEPLGTTSHVCTLPATNVEALLCTATPTTLCSW